MLFFNLTEFLLVYIIFDQYLFLIDQFSQLFQIRVYCYMKSLQDTFHYFFLYSFFGDLASHLITCKLVYLGVD